MDTEPPSDAAPGALLRLTAVAGALATAAVVASAVLELGTTHWGIALIALPLLIAVAVVVRLAYPRLFARAASAVGLFLLAIALGGVVAWMTAPRGQRRCTSALRPSLSPRRCSW